MSPFEDQNELQHVAEIKKERSAQYVLGDVLTARLLSGQDAGRSLAWLGF